MLLKTIIKMTTGKCDCCGETFDRGEIEKINARDDKVNNTVGRDIYICKSCKREYYFRCSICGKLVPNDKYNMDNTCEACFEEYYRYCYKCGNCAHIDEMRYNDGSDGENDDDESDRYCCENCYYSHCENHYYSHCENHYYSHYYTYGE